MKTSIKLFALGIVLAGFGINANAQQSVTGTGATNATIITPLTIVKATDADMNFGVVAVSATTAGTVILTPASARSVTGGVTLPSGTGTVGAAVFNVAGDGNRVFTISLPSSITLTGSVSGTMTVNTFTSTPSGTGTLSTGTATVRVGATLVVGAAQAPGEYTNAADLAVTINYN
jgi:hypothetical protein